MSKMYDKQDKKNLFVKLLLKWWSKNKRDFPWRSTRDPYSILVAEMLLGKTTAQQVKNIYPKFLAQYPNPRSLAMADKSELEELLKPLGMQHRRAELLKKLGLTIVEKYGGQIPSNPEDLLKLPGVGQYTANAILSLAYSKDVPLVDTNFIRVIQRVFGIKPQRSRARNDKKLWEFAQSLISKGNSKNFNLAILDFAAIVCRAKAPKCHVCPIRNICSYFNNKKKKP